MSKVVTHINLTVVENDDAPYREALDEAMEKYNEAKKKWDEDPKQVYAEDDDMVATGQAKTGDHKPYTGPVPTLMQIVEEAHRDAASHFVDDLKARGAQVSCTVSTVPPELQ